MRLTDNQQCDKLDFESAFPKISEQLLDRTLDSLSKEEGIFIFPNDLLDSPDLDKDSKVLESVNQQIKTANVIGFLGCGQEYLTISSRFSEAGDDYFLHYMLQKVLHLNLTRLDLGLSEEDRLYQLLIYLFPKYLQAALMKGFYKEYQRFSYNDSHVRGSLDIESHLKQNVPFTGKLAYSTREFTFDNPLLQLVRHTIDFIQNQTSVGREILSSSSATKENVEEVVRVTSAYRYQDREKIIRFNQAKPLRHAYYREYGKLQQLCLRILSRSKYGMDGSGQKIHGLLFDVSWLWEEYIYTLLPDNFLHPRNKESKYGISVFSSRTRTIYPDFYDKDLGLVLDAKYKKLEFTEKGINRADLYQLITYCYVLKSKLGALVFPSQEGAVNSLLGQLEGYGALLKKWSIEVPKKQPSYQKFVEEIEKAEEVFRHYILTEVK